MIPTSHIRRWRLKALALVIAVLPLIVGKTAAQEMKITSPAGGERIAPGDTVVIMWSADTSVATFDLKLWDGASSSWETIARDLLADSLRYTWVVPSDISGDRFRVTAGDSNSVIWAQSPTYFTVEASSTEKRADPVPLAPTPVTGLQLALRPNPSQSTTTIRLAADEIKTLRVLDMNGNIVLTATPGTKEWNLDVAKFPAGMYIVEVVSSGGVTATEKLIVN